MGELCALGGGETGSVVEVGDRLTVCLTEGGKVEPIDGTVEVSERFCPVARGVFSCGVEVGDNPDMTTTEERRCVGMQVLDAGAEDGDWNPRGVCAVREGAEVMRGDEVA